MMEQKTRNLAILFADISGSTKLFETVGDQKARGAIAATLKALAETVRANQGKVVKTIGDEVMCVFSTANRAATAACQMQETVTENNPAVAFLGPNLPLHIRIGFHFGATLVEHGDVFGDSVNVAARMAAQAKADQIITTDATIELLDTEISRRSRFVDHAPIRGKQGTVEIHELLWQEEDEVTRIATFMSAPVAPQNSAAMKVEYHDRLIHLNSGRPGLVMGRDQGCDLPIAETLASRRHAFIEMRRDKFYVVDQSTNGTFVYTQTDGETFLHREGTLVTGDGRISLGRSFSEDPTEVVIFSLIGEQQTNS